MADKAQSETSSRRPSFRKTVTEASLPQDYLDILEQKRKQLDESIHKYIAAKEREYKVYERDLRLQWRTTQPGSIRDEKLDQTPSSSVRALPVSTSLDRDVRDSKQEDEEGVDGIAQSQDTPTEDRSEALIASRPVARTKQERDQELVGLFTPSYLPALGNSAIPPLARASSDPPGNETGVESIAAARLTAALRSTSDQSVTAKSKRPAQLQLAHRTSSSGSSADGKLASAMKSPTQPIKPKRKRVSLAVGDVIVAPSDSVPVAMSHNTTPSHSRTRSPVSVLESAMVDLPEPLQAVSSVGNDRDIMANGKLHPQGSDGAVAGPTTATTTADNTTSAATVPLEQPSAKTAPKIDPDGDLFDLEDEDLNHASDDPKFGNPFESDDDVIGELDEDAALRAQSDQSPGGMRYDDEAGLIAESEEDGEEAGDHVDFGPSSSTASQQPTSPGFRRPSVSMDPVYTGNDWTRAEHEAVVDEVYGSSFARQSGKGSFAAGSLGESYMARNSEQLMRSRADQDRSHVRT